MQLRLGKSRKREERQLSTVDAPSRTAGDITARMHFYAVHNAGDQLRWPGVQFPRSKPDRMVGR
jgi:hypothetical protein